MSATYGRCLQGAEKIQIYKAYKTGIVKWKNKLKIVPTSPTCIETVKIILMT